MTQALTISGTETPNELQAKTVSGDNYTVTSKAVTQFVARYLQDELTAEQLEQIGDLLEGAEFFEYVGPGSDGIIAQVVYEFSTPQAGHPITKEAATRWLQLLDT